MEIVAVASLPALLLIMMGFAVYICVMRFDDDERKPEKELRADPRTTAPYADRDRHAR
jgi:hypothetical protein